MPIRKEPGDGDADDQSAAQAERGDDDDQDQQHRGDQAVLQLAQHVADFIRAVLGEGDLDLRWPCLAFLRHQGAHLIDGLDDVLARALGDFDADGGQAIDAGDAIPGP